MRPESVELYKKYNQPFRSLVRTCGSCEKVEIPASPTPITDLVMKRRTVDKIIPLLAEIICENDQMDCFGYSLLSKFKSEAEILIHMGRVSIATLYQTVMESLEYLILKGNAIMVPERMSQLSIISSSLIGLETNPQEWMKLQFKHITKFPQLTCSSCHDTTCFSCGVAPFHTNQTCTEHMQMKISDQQGSIELLQTLTWQLTNSKKCPNCSVMINRDEGCNKVECLYCGYKFCWHCRGEFENGNCGYYRCQLAGITAENQPMPTTDIVNFTNNRRRLGYQMCSRFNPGSKRMLTKILLFFNFQSEAMVPTQI